MKKRCCQRVSGYRADAGFAQRVPTDQKCDLTGCCRGRTLQKAGNHVFGRLYGVAVRHDAGGWYGRSEGGASSRMPGGWLAAGALPKGSNRLRVLLPDSSGYLIAILFILCN